ncbi:hypothetical protein ACLOJK_000821 [Asimina triloba]
MWLKSARAKRQGAKGYFRCRLRAAAIPSSAAELCRSDDAREKLRAISLLRRRRLVSRPPSSPPAASLLPKNQTQGVQSKRFSTNSSSSANDVQRNELVLGGHEMDWRRAAGFPEEGIRHIPVLFILSSLQDFGFFRATLEFLTRCINLKSMQTENACNPPTSRSLNYVALQYFDYPPEITGTRIKLDWSCYRYMVVFQYGSAVLFNIADNEVERYLDVVRKHASGLLPEIRKDDYAVVEKPKLATWMEGGHDYIVLRNLDTDSIRIIASVLGQSIALDHFIRQVDWIVEEFTDINRSMEKSGTFIMQQKKLFQLLGKANSNLADVIIKLGLFERSEIAWRNANYAEIFEYLRDEYELVQRFGSLDFKLKFVEIGTNVSCILLDKIGTNARLVHRKSKIFSCYSVSDPVPTFI